MLKFQILGMTEIQSVECTVRPARTLQRALPATILVSGRRLVPTKTIVDQAWGSEFPDGAENAAEAARPLGARPAVRTRDVGVIATAPCPVQRPEHRSEIRP